MGSFYETFAAGAVCPDQRGCALHAELAGQRQIAGDGVRAGGAGVEQGIVVIKHQALPGGCAIGRAPDRDGLLLSLEGDEEGVDGDVVELG